MGCRESMSESAGVRVLIDSQVSNLCRMLLVLALMVVAHVALPPLADAEVMTLFLGRE